MRKKISVGLAVLTVAEEAAKSPAPFTVFPYRENVAVGPDILPGRVTPQISRLTVLNPNYDTDILRSLMDSGIEETVKQITVWKMEVRREIADFEKNRDKHAAELAEAIAFQSFETQDLLDEIKSRCEI